MQSPGESAVVYEILRAIILPFVFSAGILAGAVSRIICRSMCYAV